MYGLLVLIWSSTWVAIKIGLEDCPPLLGAGVRFAAAGLVLLAIAAIQRCSNVRCIGPAASTMLRRPAPADRDELTDP